MSTVNDYLSKHAGNMEDTKVVSTMATGVRLAQYPDGSQKIQGAYSWVKGFTTGFVWMDLPVVMVGMSGQIIEEDEQNE